MSYTFTRGLIRLQATDGDHIAQGWGQTFGFLDCKARNSGLLQSMSGRKRIAFVRYSPFASIPLPTLVAITAIGIASGVYIFDELVRDATLKVSSPTSSEKPQPSSSVDSPKQ